MWGKQTIKKMSTLVWLALRWAVGSVDGIRGAQGEERQFRAPQGIGFNPNEMGTTLQDLECRSGQIQKAMGRNPGEN